MSNSKALEIRNAVVASLQAATAVAELIRVGRRVALPESRSEGVYVYLDYSAIERGQLQHVPDDWKTRVRVEIAARGVNAVPAEDRADTLMVAVHARVMADPSLGGLCVDLYPIGITWDGDEADTTLAVCQVIFEAVHRVAADSIAATP